MGTLYIDRRDIEVRMDGNALAFYANGRREGLVPIVPLKRVVICGRALIESSVLGRLAEENVSVVFLSGKHQRFRGMLHGRLHNNGLLRLKQYEASLSPLALSWARDLVRRKVEGHKTLLEDALEARPDRRRELFRGVSSLASVLSTIEEDRESDRTRLRGLEGAAAAAYFQAYCPLFAPSLGFRARRRRPPTDPVNALLSLTYTLVHAEAVRELELAGMDPTIGFYHEFDYGRESLACDLVEVLRPLCDRWIWSLMRDRVFTARSFTTGGERPGCYLKKDGRKTFYALYEEWAVSARGVLSNEVRSLVRMVMGDEYNEDLVP